MAPPTSLLLKNGTVLVHGAQDRVSVLKVDVLVLDNKIAAVEENITTPSDDTLVIDCTGKIVSPGFVDTHHHVWQTQLKGRHANDTLLDYIPKGNLAGKLFTPEDIFWGELGGCLEAIDGGTTMVVDHAHMTYSAEHVNNAISATVSSGIRSYFCYSPTMLVQTWDPLVLEPSDSSQLGGLAKQQPFGDGRVQLGLGFDGIGAMPKEAVVALYTHARALGVKLITSHYVPGPIVGRQSVVELLNSYDLLRSDILLSHATNATPNDATLLSAANAHVSATPDTEMQMGHGFPVCFRDDLQRSSSLGVDCHSNNSGDMLTQMRLALQSARAAYNQPFVDAGKAPKTVAHTVEAAFNLGTIQGARAVGMEVHLGSISVGKLADLVVFSGESPAMICAAEHDPVAAIVLHASVRDVETVIIDGKLRKRDGKLLPVEDLNRKNVEWKDVARELLDSRKRIQSEAEKLDLDAVKAGVMRAWRMDSSNFVETL
ncbi:5-methylthioadenosine/S-adenosylhomocysteine deaminase n1 [Mycena kentingensis (nom. inval.)]|nr:5-methylthioadenosine/S-adenosylhomocysteine deaminase n1 [Mycena kentingensis (nom. inval.)]